MHSIFKSCKKWGLLVFLAVMLGLFLYVDAFSYLNFATIKLYKATIQQWTSQHYYLAITLYILIFTLLIAATIPAATLLALLGGFLFGASAVIYAILGTTLGGLILFFAIRTSIGSHIAKRRSGWIKVMEKGFQENAFFYLLMLRLMPVCPCWISNISAGALNVPSRTFIIATIIGVTPATVIYVMAGRGLETLFRANTPPSMESILTPAVSLPLIGLALLSITPVIYKYLKKSKKNG